MAAGDDRYGCSEVSGGCGEKFASLKGFDDHLVRLHPDGSGHGRHCGCSDWWPECRSQQWLWDHGWKRDDHGVWRSPNDLEATTRLAARPRRAS